MVTWRALVLAYVFLYTYRHSCSVDGYTAMWWIAEVFVLAVFSIHSGNWIAKQLYYRGWFDYYNMDNAKAICLSLVGILSILYLVFKP